MGVRRHIALLSHTTISFVRNLAARGIFYCFNLYDETFFSNVVTFHWLKVFLVSKQFQPLLMLTTKMIIQGVSRVSAKAKLKNRHFTGGYRGSKPFFLTLQSGSKFPMDKRSIKDVYYSPFQQQEKSAKLQILHFWRCFKTWSFALYWP